MASERTDELYKVLLDRGYPKGFETKRVMKINFEQPIPQEVGELLCPRCGGKLVLREATKGANAGNKFYGCSGFPKCRYIRNL